MKALLELPDGGRIGISEESGWYSDSRPQIARLMNLVYKIDHETPGAARGMLDKVIQRWGWQEILTPAPPPDEGT